MNDNRTIYGNEEEGIDIKQYIFRIIYYWWWFAIFIFIALTIAYMFSRYSEKNYEANCSIIVGEEGSQPGSTESLLEELSRVRTRKRKALVENEISILKSYKLARMALEELDFGITYVAVGRRGIAETKLYKNSPFYVVPDTTKPNITGQLINITIISEDKYILNIDEHHNISQTLEFGQPFNHPSFNFTIYLHDTEFQNMNQNMSRNYYFIINNMNKLVNQYRSSLAVEVNDEKGSVLNLVITGYVREQIATYLNKLSEVYIRSNLNEKNQVSENTIAFIDEQLSGIVDSLEAAGIRLQNFRSAKKVIDLSKEGSILFQQMEDLQREKAMLDINSRYYNYLLNYIKNKKDYSDVVAPSLVGIQDQLLNSLVHSLNELSMEQRNISFTVMENSPQIVIIKAQIDNIRNTLLENVSNLIENNKIALDNINERMNRIEKDMQKLPYTERQLINIQREFNINDQIYTFLLEKRAEAGITKASNISAHKILDISRPENAIMIRPKISTNYIMAIVLGGLIPLLLIILLEYFNTKIINRKDIENNTNTPILGSVGHSDLESELPVFENPKSALAESFRSLRSSMQYILKDNKKKVLTITSTISGEGKTFCAINLAVIMAMAGKKTLLLSLDLRRPTIHRAFNIKNTTGLSTYLSDQSKADEIIHTSPIENLFIANAGPIPPNPAELIGSGRLIKFMEKINMDFDYIIIDTPPVAVVTDALLLQNIVDIYIFVIRHGYSTINTLQLINDLYNKKELKNLVVLVNDVRTKGYYGYGYRYGYGYDYGYGYGYYSKGYYEEDIGKEGLSKRLTNIFKKVVKH